MMAAEGLHPRPVGLLSDFGDRDGYVGSMKAVMLGINPQLALVDISHAIAPGDIEEAAFVLKSAYRSFPAGSCFVVVVDPGVGGSRALVGLETEQYAFFAPDNGVLAWIEAENPGAVIVRLDPAAFGRSSVSGTFQGRDLLAPAAAHWSLGESMTRLGSPAVSEHGQIVPSPQSEKGRTIGEIVHIDGFGNCISNIPDPHPQQGKVREIRLHGLRLKGMKEFYAQVQIGQPLALIGSHGMIEIAINRGNAASAFGIKRGNIITIIFEEL